jgi:hypothetical protein
MANRPETVQQIAQDPGHKDAEFAKRVLEDDVYWWLTFALLFEKLLTSQGHAVQPRKLFSRQHAAISAWVSENERRFALTAAPAGTAPPVAVVKPPPVEEDLLYELLGQEVVPPAPATPVNADANHELDLFYELLGDGMD